MTIRSLSRLEAKLILRLEWDKQYVVTAEDVIRILEISPDHARQVLHRLAMDRWLALITPGKYELIPADRGEYAFTDTNPLFVGSVLVSPYYFSFATAAYFHGLSTQAALTVYIATTQDKPRQMLVRDKAYRLVRQPAYKFFGWTEISAYGSQVNMAQPEKTILDCLDRPGFSGDIPEIAAMLAHGSSMLDWDKMADYAAYFKSQALVQRLGYLLNVLEIPIEGVIQDRLFAASGSKSKCYLGQPGRWGIGGNYHSVWRVVDNIPYQELIAEIEAR